MRWMFAVLLSTIVLLGTGSPCAAGTDNGTGSILGSGAWLTISGSWNTYAMKDINDAITGMRTYIPTLPKITGQPGLGGALGFTGRRSGAFLGVGFDRLSASTDGTATIPGSQPITLSIHENLPANAVRGFIGVCLPQRGPVGAALAIGAGVVTMTGTVEQTTTRTGGASSNLAADVKGQGTLLEGTFSLSYWLNPQFGLVGDLGYRQAKIKEVKGTMRGYETTLQNEDGSNLSIDYSGLVSRIGLRVCF